VPEEYVRTSGFFKVRLVKGGRMVGMRIWWGPPPDPEDPRRVLDRSPRWQMQVNGGEIVSVQGDDSVMAGKLGGVWSSREPCTKEDYDYLLATVKWDTDSGRGPDPKEKVDFKKLRFDHLPGEKK
jgi:hypothetical protein